MKKTKSSKRWLKEHFSDIYVKRAQQEGFRARSVYKLMEMQDRYKIIKPGMVVVELGAAPGGWSEYIVQIVGSNGKIFSLDILPMRPIKGVEFIQGDFTKDEVLNDLSERLQDEEIDVVLSDMAPNLSGLSIVDQARSMELVKKSFSFARKELKQGGVFLTKMFQGSEAEEFLKEIRHYFTEVKVIKPDASRMRSSEVFLLAKDFKKHLYE